MLVLVIAHAGLAAALPCWGRRTGRAVWVIAALPLLAALVWSAVRAPDVLRGAPVRESLAWAPSLGLSLDLRLDALSLLMVWVISGVGAAVLAYSAYYTERDTGREAGLLLAFAGAMTGLVLADNLFVLYVFWELTTLASYFLIAGPERSRERRRAAEQALLTTVAGGLALLAGLVVLGETAGTYRISGILADPPRGAAVTVAMVLLLLGAFAKSAQMPLHGWLPAAMVAPTPVSAYLHAATMVKAGVYLVARFAPGFADVPPWRPAVFAVGLVSMVLGAWRALRETDLKRLLAYGTISELGMLMVLFGAGTRTAAMAGAVMLAAHAAFKATLFLVTGILDHQAGTRDVRELSGAGRRMPGVFAAALLAALSMAGVPPLLGFLGKEAGYEAFLHGTGIGGRLPVLAGLVLGSVLTVAYAGRFLWGAFARKPWAEPGTPEPPARGFLAPAALLSAAGLVLGLWYQGMAAPARAYADRYPAGPEGPYELALWHGLTPVLGLSVLTLLLGAALYAAHRERADGTGPWWKTLVRLPDSQRAYRRTVRATDLLALRLARGTQVGSLPVYLAVLLCAVLALPGAALAVTGTGPAGTRLWTSSVQLPLVLVILAAAVAVTATRHRLTGVLLVGAVGYGVAGLFLLRGAPDLALTQFLVETLTLVIVVFVLRRMPARFSPEKAAPRTRILQGALAGAIGVLVGVFTLAAAGARRAPAVSEDYFRLLPETGAHNAVNAIVVDFRALDTLGEIAVLLVAALGVVSLAGVRRRGGDEAGPARTGNGTTGAGGEPGDRTALSPTAQWDEPRECWLPGGSERPGGERSLLLEVSTWMAFPSLMVVSVFLLFSGHSHPGGGFSGGLVAGLACVLRYLVGGRDGLGTTAPVDPGLLAGGGLALAAGTGLVPALFGAEPLSGVLVEAHHLPVIGTLKFSTTLFFDMGVYLLVIGVALKLLSALGTNLAPAPRRTRTPAEGDLTR
ncbi:Na+/H+ antiporter subunit A [Streptomyces sp. WAC 00631]|uniref:Na+/H+ antiporter subunit A n=1 Tax=Streptomyces sp. WAC 00631 TaxID=2203201 RepID=UPI000F79B3B4|nr:Na+/H+ antiporter subunit A [Streptomyces sp. WAC 00631]MCC5033616.1 Na+/H+ antiporter subunit A [Streptomyces sp. WAC 00631]